jgi:ABC-type dipeptide/oligopeptide/nickel transport system ATPase component
MSDTFDHWGDALDSRDESLDFGGMFSLPRKPKKQFNKNPLHYYTKIVLYEILKETEAAFQLRTSLGTFWSPKALIKEMHLHKRVCYILTDFYEKKLTEIGR